MNDKNYEKAVKTYEKVSNLSVEISMHYNIHVSKERYVKMVGNIYYNRKSQKVFYPEISVDKINI